MNILLLIKYFEVGGAESYVVTLANQLAKMGQKVFVMGRNGRQKGNLSPSISFQQLHINDFEVFSQTRYLLDFIRKEKIQIIHAHQHGAIYLASRVSKRSQIPTIATIHGRLKYDLRSKFSKKQIGGIIVSNENSLKGAKAIPLLKNKIEFIRNGVQNNGLGKLPSDDKFVMLYSSRLNKRHYKILSMLVQGVLPELLKSYPKIQLIITGDGKYAAKITKDIQEFNKHHGKESVFYLGYRTVFTQSQLLVSLFMGSGSAAIECLQNSIPVVSLHPNHLGTLIVSDNYEEYRYGNFVALDSEEPDSDKLLKLLMRLLKNPEILKYDKQELSEWSKRDYDVYKNTKQVLLKYQELIEQFQ